MESPTRPSLGSHRRWLLSSALVSPCCATQPVEPLLGRGISASITVDGLHDDGLGRTLDWL